MSFILDALKKSQATRQRHTGPGTIAVETAPGSTQSHNWWAMVIAIVIINLTVLIGFIYWTSRDDRGASVNAATQTDSGASTAEPRQARGAPGNMLPETSRPIRQQAVAQRGEVKPLSAEVRDPRAAPPPATPAETPSTSAARSAANQPAPVIQPPPSADSGYLPTLAELQLANRVSLSPLHVDVHVFNENPQRRFVLVNSRKYKEGERLSEGPLLEAIRRDGLVMYYRGERFLVPRD